MESEKNKALLTDTTPNPNISLIIGAGMSRTGTNSLKQALEILGYNPSYHFYELVLNLDQEFWIRVLNGEKFSWDEVLTQYKAVTDVPCCYYWEDILKKYPNSKVILTIRSPESWLKSFKDVLKRLLVNTPFGTWFFVSMFPYPKMAFNIMLIMCQKILNDLMKV